MNASRLTPIERALEAFAAGRQVIIVDDEDRENEGDLVVAADFATSEAINFMTVHGRGLVCLAMRGELIDRLRIPMMVPIAENRSGFGTGFTVSVEAARGVSTGISTPDRAETVRVLIDPASTIDDIAMPGHIFPLRARDGGVLERRGQTEASVDFARLAGLTPAGVICEVMREDGDMMRFDELCAFADAHDLPIVSVEQIARHRSEGEDPLAAPASIDEAAAAMLVHEVARSKLPTEHGQFDIAVYRDAQGLEHSLLWMGDPAAIDEAADGAPPLVRLHSECLTGDAFGSFRCDCGEQLQAALDRIASDGVGALLYLRQEGRGIGLGNKIRAYALQDRGADTVEANEALGFPADARTYDVAAAMLRAHGITRLRLMSNNPAKQAALEAAGLDVAAREAHAVPSRDENRGYLNTKASRMGHIAPDASGNADGNTDGNAPA